MDATDIKNDLLLTFYEKGVVCADELDGDLWDISLSYPLHDYVTDKNSVKESLLRVIFSYLNKCFDKVNARGVTKDISVDIVASRNNVRIEVILPIYFENKY